MSQIKRYQLETAFASLIDFDVTSKPDDLIMRGIQGEEYPIGRELFNQTYRMLNDEMQSM